MQGNEQLLPCVGQTQTSSSMDSKQKERNICNQLLIYNMKQTMSKKILENRKNTKQLFKIVSKVTNSNQQISLPDGNPEELAEEFADYFINKIITMREFVRTQKKHTPRPSNAPLFRRFAPFTEDKVRKEIFNINTKSCKLDQIPTALLKQLVPTCLSTIMQLVNISLTQGVFNDEWMTAIIRPLL